MKKKMAKKEKTVRNRKKEVKRRLMRLITRLMLHVVPHKCEDLLLF